LKQYDVYVTALISRAKEEGSVNASTFSADTGASNHMSNTNRYLEDIMDFLK
jgi:hypothetical protein